MGKQMEMKKKRGRPRSDDPKMKLDNVRLKTSTIVDIEIIAEIFKISPSAFIQILLDNETPKYKYYDASLWDLKLGYKVRDIEKDYIVS